MDGLKYIQKNLVFYSEFNWEVLEEGGSFGGVMESW